MSKDYNFNKDFLQHKRGAENMIQRGKFILN
jgi:hypothetical protein